MAWCCRSLNRPDGILHANQNWEDHCPKVCLGLSEDDFANPDIKIRLVDLDEGIHSKIGDDLKDKDIDPVLRGSMPEVSDDVFDDEDGNHNDAGDAPSPEEETDDHTPESYDEFLTAQVLLPHGGEAKKATVVGRKGDHDGRPIGKRHANPLLDTRLYKVEFSDGSTEAIAANLIVENMLSQVDDEGRSYSVLSGTNGHSISKDNGLCKAGMVRDIRKPLRKVGTCKLSGVMVQQPGYHCRN